MFADRSWRKRSSPPLQNVSTKLEYRGQNLRASPRETLAPIRQPKALSRKPTPAPTPSSTTDSKNLPLPCAKSALAMKRATKSNPAISLVPLLPSANRNISRSSRSSKSIAGCCSTAAWKPRSKISTSRARSSAAFTSDSARKPAPAHRLTRCIKMNGSAR